MKKSKKKEAKFFCESCGSEVPGRAKVCPVCGKFFASVRCPKCGRTGSSEDFKNGCPTCGYAIHPEDIYEGKSDYNFKNINKSNGKNNESSFLSKLFSNKNKDTTYYNSDAGLPVWVYIVTLVVLGILIVCLYSCL